MTIPSITRFIATLALVGIAIAGATSMLWGLPAGIAAISAFAGLVALAKALIELAIRLATAELPPSESARPDAITIRELKRVVVLSLLAGVGFGYVLPSLVAWAGRPRVSVEIPSIVRTRQPAVFTWRNVPDDRTALLIVHSRRDDVSFPQPCQSDGRRRGRLDCDLEIGGTDDGGGTFEVAAVLASAAAREELLRVSRDPGYFRKLSNQVEIVTRKPVTRMLDYQQR